MERNDEYGLSWAKHKERRQMKLKEKNRTKCRAVDDGQILPCCY